MTLTQFKQLWSPRTWNKPNPTFIDEVLDFCWHAIQLLVLVLVLATVGRFTLGSWISDVLLSTASVVFFASVTLGLWDF
jgi:hypothetical protein